jgi:hypothetical protein
MIFSGNNLFAGDGTLPVIRSIEVEFLERGHELQNSLPKCMNIVINKAVKDSVEKSILLKKANLEQIVLVNNNQGDLSVVIKARTISDRVLLQMRRQDLNQSEFLNDFRLQDNQLRQYIQINPDQLNSNCIQI